MSNKWNFKCNLQRKKNDLKQGISELKTESTLAKITKPAAAAAAIQSRQSCPTLCDPMDCSLRGSSVHGILQARILKWVSTSYSRGSSQPRAWNWVSHTAGRFFTVGATREGITRMHIARKSGNQFALSYRRTLGKVENLSPLKCKLGYGVEGWQSFRREEKYLFL